MSLLSANLQAFIAITKLQTVQSAAKDLGITQTGVTQRIRSLESQLATTLFIRSRRGMLLTEEGKALLRYCQAAQGLEGEALARIQGAGVKAEIRFGMTGPSSIMRARVIPASLEVLKKFPEVRVTFNISDIETWVDDLRSGKSQMAIVPPHLVGNEMDSKTLKSEKYVLVASKQWSNRTLKEIIKTERIIDFDSSDQMTFSYLQKFHLLASARKERHFLNNTESLVNMFREGLGYGVLTSEFAKSYLERGDLITLNSGSSYEHEQALAWYPRHEMPAYFSMFVKTIK